MKRRKRSPQRRPSTTDWDPLAYWYDGWVGRDGSHFHQKVAIPEVIEMLELEPEETVLDLGAGQGVLSPFVTKAGASYTGVDLSPKLIKLARRHHSGQGRFLIGDATALADVQGIEALAFSACVFLLSLQDMDPLESAVESAAWALRPGGRLVVLLTHPCFRVPRQSGWGWDSDRKLQFRRVDRYLTPLPVPLKPHPGKGGGVSRSFHRPLQDYVNAMSRSKLFIDRMREIPTFKQVRKDPRAKAINRSNAEIPLFLALRAVKIDR